MTGRRDSLIVLFAAVLRIGRIFNYAFAVCAVAALLASFGWSGPLASRLAAKYGTGDAATVLTALRWLVVLGLIAAIAAERIFAALNAILASLRDGEPFRVANAARVQTIGWALLVLQLLDLGLGGFALLFTRIGVNFVSWTPSFTGWLGVLVAFVLARVFRVGAAMRDDLEGTV